MLLQTLPLEAKVIPILVVGYLAGVVLGNHHYNGGGQSTTERVMAGMPSTTSPN